MNAKTHSPDEIYFAAMERESPEERAAYLREACGSDVDLRRRVERLLRAQSKIGDFMDSPALGPTIGLTPTHALEAPGDVIGPYKLLEEIGEGGMGTVFMAEQSRPVRRKVALKVVKPGMDTKQVVARFEAERQALALMDHPNIAKVLDAGATESGRPYFVMELVRGIPITEYCDREHLTIAERLELFVLVCRAVQHAHQKGVIHRDLKPSNILVTVIDGTAVPKIIDFGIAKATGGTLTDRTLYTGFAQLIGTPLYMSPEQADLSGVDVDTRSDIYSLAVLLYELLTGTTPFDGDTIKKAAFDEVRRIVREQDPPKPSTRISMLGESLTTISAKRKAAPKQLGHALRGELDWIVMKALEKDRRRRYETANDFAADVMRYLTDKPVEACPPSTWYRFAKYARRNRVVLTASALVGAALIAGTAVSVWQARKARQAAAAAAARADETQQIVDYLFKDVFGAASPERWQKSRPMTVSELLAQAEATISERFRGKPLVEARCRAALADLYFLIDAKKAEAHAARAVELFSEVLGFDHPDTLKAREVQIYVMGLFWANPGVQEKRVPLIRSLLADRRRVLGATHPDTIAAMSTLADGLAILHEFAEAEVLAATAQADGERFLGPLHPVTLLALRNHAVVASLQGQDARAEALIRRATDGYAQAGLMLDPAALLAHGDCIAILRREGKIVEAIPVAERALDAATSLWGENGIRTEWAFGRLVGLYRDSGNQVAYRDFVQNTLRQELATPRDASPDSGRKRSARLAYSALRLVTLPEGIPFDRNLALSGAQEAVAQHGDWDDPYTILAVVYYRFGQLDDAMKAIQASTARPRWKGGDDFDWLVLALIHARRGEMDEARQWYNKARNRKNPVDFNRDDLKPLREEAEALLSMTAPPKRSKSNSNRKPTSSRK
jgi:serine/threonine protein kinase/tetratricopeptide (TPR) repeat protein